MQFSLLELSKLAPLLVEYPSLPLASLRCCFLPSVLCTVTVASWVFTFHLGIGLSHTHSQPRELVGVYPLAQPVLCTTLHPLVVMEKKSVMERAISVAGSGDEKGSGLGQK